MKLEYLAMMRPFLALLKQCAMGENGKKEWILMVVEDRMQFEEITFSLCVSEIQFRRFKCFKVHFFVCEGTVRTMIIMSNGRSFFLFFLAL